MNFPLNLVPNRTQLFLALSDSKKLLVVDQPTHWKQLKILDETHQKHWFEGTGGQKGIWVLNLARCCRARFSEGRGVLGVSPTLSDPPPPGSVEPRGWTSQEERWSCRWHGAGIHVNKEQGLWYTARTPREKPSGLLPRSTEVWMLTSSLTNDWTPALFQLNSRLKAICPILSACQTAKLDPLQRKKTSATDCKYLHICSYTAKYNNWS